MSGHSKWANIKHKKAAVDAKRGKTWSRIAKQIIIAARTGGDPSMNPRLRLAVDSAKAVGMPRDNIERAIKRGTGELTSGQAEKEMLYEGYGTAGTAVLCEILTDNPNRTASEVRKIFEAGGGKMGVTGCVGWMFDRKGMFVIDSDAMEEDKLMDIALEAGAEDMTNQGGVYEILTAPDDFMTVAAALEAAKVPIMEATISRIPQNTVDIDDIDTARRILRMIERLEEHDDVSAVYSNHSIVDAVQEKLDEEDE